MKQETTKTEFEVERTLKRDYCCVRVNHNNNRAAHHIPKRSRKKHADMCRIILAPEYDRKKLLLHKNKSAASVANVSRLRLNICPTTQSGTKPPSTALGRCCAFRRCAGQFAFLAGQSSQSSRDINSGECEGKQTQNPTHLRALFFQPVLPEREGSSPQS